LFAQFITREGMWNVGCIGYVMDLTNAQHLRFQLKGVTSEWTVGNNVDGVLEAEGDHDGEPDSVDDPLMLGSGEIWPFLGIIDDVGIFNQALIVFQPAVL
jgi:hypothetical protein